MSNSTQLVKYCSTCGEHKPSTTEYFQRDSQKKDGLCHYCKICLAQKNAQRRATPESLKYQREYKEKYNRAKGVKPARRAIVKDGVRYCLTCGEWKLDTSQYFPLDKRRGQLAASCRKCASKTSMRWAKEHKEHIHELAKHQRQNPLTKIKRLESRKALRQTEKYKSSTARYLASEQGKAIYLAAARRRAAHKRQLPSNFTALDWRYALDYFGNCCAACGRPNGFWHTLSADHWIPITDSHPDNPGTVPWNIVPLCYGLDGCNNSKGNREANEWLMEKFGKRKAKRIESRIIEYFAGLKR